MVSSLWEWVVVTEVHGKGKIYLGWKKNKPVLCLKENELKEGKI
jgi:hypothetical protein